MKKGMDTKRRRGREGTWVVRYKAQGCPSVGENRHSVPERRVLGVEGGGVAGGIEHTLAITQDPELVAMEMPRMNLAVVGCQCVGVL